MLYAALGEIVNRFPDRPAVVSKNSNCSYQDLWSRSETLASELRGRNITAGDRVAILAENSLDSVAAWWAVIKCNAICINLNEKLKPSGMQYIIDDATPAFYLCGTTKLLDLLPAGLPHLCLDTFNWEPPEKVQSTFAEHSGDDPNKVCGAICDNVQDIACIVYTSGSTGNPKGVCLTHDNLLSVGNIAADGFGLTELDRYLMVVPLHYIHGLMMLMSLQLRGSSLEFMPSFVFPSAVTQTLKNKDITGFSGVPYHFSALIERGKFLTTQLPQLRWICITGGTVTPDRILQLLEAKPNTEIHIAYGQTECSPRITMLDPERISRKPTSVGAAAPGLDIVFLNDAGEPVASGDTGELVVSGRNVMHGYWNDPENTASVIDELGRLHTGDLAYMDSEGDVFIRGRLQAMIKSAGERIFPEELEAILNKHPDVDSVAVVGQPDELYGQVVEAHIVLSSTSELPIEDTIKGIETFCLEHVPFARAPRRYQHWQEFPLKANGKTDKQHLIKNSTRG
jgi:long-chain acyl-CoA synthetase